MQPTDKAGFVDLWHRLFPVDYTDGLEQGDGLGADIANAQAAIFARVSGAANATTQAYFVRPHSDATGPFAAGSERAVGTVELTRAAPADFAITLLSGTRFQAVLRGTIGQELIVGEVESTVDLTLAAGVAVGSTFGIPARAVIAGFAGNFGAGLVARFTPRGRASALGTVLSTTSAGDTRAAFRGGDAFTLAQVGQYVRFVGLPSGVTAPRRIIGVTPGATNTITFDPPLAAGDVGATPTIDVEEFEDIGLAVAPGAAFSGGTDGELEAAAADRDIARTPGEADPSLRDRVVSLADVVAPNAIVRACNRLLLPAGIRFRFLEVRDPDNLRGFFADLDPVDFGSLDIIPKVPGSVLIGDGIVVLGRTRFFLILVSPGNAGEFGGGVDSPMFPNDNAADWMFTDGYPVGYNGLIGALAQQLDQIKAGGVAYQIQRDQTL